MSDVIIKAVSHKSKGKIHKNVPPQRDIRLTQQYIDDEKKHGHKVLVLEDVKVQGSFNLLATDRQNQIEEIKARHNQYKGKAKKCEHYVLSYAKGKPPKSYGRQDFEKDVQEFMECMGMVEYAALYAVHQNTDNVHVHIILDRVARIPKGGKFYVPTDTGAVVKTRKDGTRQRHDPDCMQTAIARICDRNKWQGGNIRCDADGKPSSKKRKGIKKQPPHVDPKKVEFMLLVNNVFTSSNSWNEAQENFDR